MAKIVINEISQNYTYNIGNTSYCTVALPITASWGPCYFNDADTPDLDDRLEKTKWLKFPSTRDGMDSFVNTFKGTTSCYKAIRDFSYQYAMTLLSSGHDVLVCRLSDGANAQYTAKFKATASAITSTDMVLKAKYPGTFGNNIIVTIEKIPYTYIDFPAETSAYWRMTVYAVDQLNGNKSAVESKIFTLESRHIEDNIPLWSEIESEYIDIVSFEGIDDSYVPDSSVYYTKDPVDGGEIPVGFSAKLGSSVKSGTVVVTLTSSGDTPTTTTFTDNGNGSFVDSSATPVAQGTINYATGLIKFTVAQADVVKLEIKADPASISKPICTTSVTVQGTDFKDDVTNACTNAVNSAKARFNDAFGITNQEKSYIDLFADAGSDPQTYSFISTLNYTDYEKNMVAYREWLFESAYNVYDILKDKLNYSPQRIISPGWDDQDFSYFGATISDIATMVISPLHIKLINVAFNSRCATSMLDIPKSLPRKFVHVEDGDTLGYAQQLGNLVPLDSDAHPLYTTHSSLFAPWGNYQLIGMTRQVLTAPSLLAILIQRAMIKNQSVQYEWALPTNRRHNLRIGKLQYDTPTKILDEWQKLDGVGVNALTSIPDLGMALWGNSTLFDVPPAVYQALANLSTRYLVNAVEDIAYRCGISITFQYNNEQAFNKFYAGVTPTLDTMRNVGAIEDYYVEMAADINGMDQVNANSVIGKIYLVIDGVINDIFIDLIALPPGTDLTQYQ